MLNRLSLILLLSIVLVSCTGQDNDADMPLQRGTEGIDINFLDGIHDEVMQKTRMYATIELHNKGFADVSDAILILSLEEDFMTLDSWDMPDRFSRESPDIIRFDLAGKNLGNKQGEKQVISPIIVSKKIDDTRDKITSLISASVCYPYSTILSDTICIDTDPAGLSIAEKTCKVKDITSSGQGAPVVIKKVEQKVIPGPSQDTIGLQFTIYAENNQDGIIVSHTDYADVCKGINVDIDDYNKLLVKDIRFSGYALSYGDMECEPNPMRETDDGFMTRCSLKEARGIEKNRLTFETPLVIELDYGYKSTISHELDILNR